MTSDDDKAPKEQQQHQEQQLSLQQLQDVRARLKQPLTDRSVLIPCGTMAFFEGRLTPSTTAAARLEDDAAAGDGKPAAALHECVTVRMPDGTEKELTRPEALDHLQKEIEERKEETKKAKAKAAAAAPKQKVSPPEKKAAAQTSSNRAASSQKQAVPAREPNSATMLPFIEIREELNESGQAIRCKTIDVTQQLKNLKSKGEEEVSSSFGPSAVHEKDDMDEKEAAMDTPTNSTVDPNDNKPKPLSDSEYDALAARLDELAKLEEHAEANKSVNLKSSKKLQSRGWSKGFLNSPTKKPKKKQVPPKTAAPDASNTSAVKLSPTLAANVTSRNPPPDAPSSKTVAFGDTEIREIPRVGERSVRATVPRPPSRPLDEAVFPGVVQEKKAAAGASHDFIQANNDKPKKVSRFAQERQASRGSEQQKPQPSKKKVSRFAQERQQGLR